jgi:transmembrane 9 superfamily protein 3
LLLAQYAVGEAVRLWVNKVGPYNNPQETYNYYHLPFCKPNQAVKPAHKWGGLGEVLQGNELIDSQLDLRFRSAHTTLIFALSGWLILPSGWL